MQSICGKEEDCGNCISGYLCYLGSCVEPGVCGNGIHEPGEDCDDGVNNGNVGYCNESCSGLIGDYYISQLDSNCNDSGPGTSEMPWCNLTKPCASGGVIPYRWVPEGSVVIVREGNYGYYSETTQSNCINNISLVQRNEWTTYMADAGDNVIIDGMKLGTNWNYDAQGRHYQIWDGFEITGGISIIYTDYIIIRNCDMTIHALPYEGVYAPYYPANAEVIDGRSSNNITIENNSIHNSYRGIGISDNSGDIIIRGNEIYRMGEDGMSISGGSNKLLMEGNYIHDSFSRWTGITFMGLVDYNGGTGFIDGDVVTQDITRATGIIKSDNGEGETTLAIYQTSEEELLDDPSFVIINIDNASESFTINGNNSHYFTKENLFKVRQSRNEVYYTLGVYTLKSFNYDAVSGTTTLFVNEDIINDSSPYGTAYPAYYAIRNNRSEILWGIHYTDTTHRDGFQMGGSSNVLIKNNYFINTGQGFKLDGGQLYNITVVGNVIDTSGWNMLLTAFVRNLNIINNTVVGNRITFSQDITASIHNNIIDVMYIGWNATILSHSSNIFRGNPDGYKSSIYIFEVDYDTELVGYNISNLFVNETGDDFRVRMNSPACDGSLNGMAAVPVGALGCVCRNNTDCIFGGNCVDWECQGTKNCLETEYSCGSFPDCVNCNFLDGCYGDFYREYSCTNNAAGCEYIEDNCIDDCSCSCGGYGNIESTEMNNCADGIDNDCDGDIDGSDYGCQPVSGIPLDYSAYFRFEGTFIDYTNNNGVAWLGENKDKYEKRLDDNYAKTFDGVANRIGLPNNENFNLFENFTISVWVKTINAETDAIICRGSLFYGYYGQYTLYSEGVGDKVRYIFALSNGTRKTFVSEQIYNIGEWNHVVAKFNGTTGSLFINGVKVKEEPTEFSELQQAPGSYSVAYIGEGKEGRYLNGSLDDLIVYKRALTDSEIQQIYNVQKDSGLGTLSIFSKIWNWLKGILTRKTAYAITGNIVKNNTSD